MNHTPGPWRCRILNGLWRVERDDPSDHQLIASVYGAQNGGYAQDNAQLISSAPMMLDVCLIAYDVLDKWVRRAEGADFHEPWEQIRKTIRQAKGVL